MMRMSVIKIDFMLLGNHLWIFYFVLTKCLDLFFVYISCKNYYIVFMPKKICSYCQENKTAQNNNSMYIFKVKNEVKIK